MVSAVLNPDRLPRDKVTLADFAACWNGMIERSERLLGHFPPDRLPQLRFEDMEAAAEAQIRRLARFTGPTFEDEAWLREAVTIPRPTPSKFERLPADERAAITRACRLGLERLGYPLRSRQAERLDARPAGSSTRPSRGTTIHPSPDLPPTGRRRMNGIPIAGWTSRRSPAVESRGRAR